MKIRKILIISVGLSITTLVPITTIVSCASFEKPVKPLPVKKPTKASIDMTFVGTPGAAKIEISNLNNYYLSYVKIVFKYVDGSIKGKLNIGDKIQLIISPIKGYVWNTTKTGSDPFTLDYTVEVITPAA